jgi:hypothetical protein
MKRLIVCVFIASVLPLGVLAAQVSTADWNTNATLAIKAYDEGNNLNTSLSSLLTYVQKLLDEAKAAAQEDDGRKQKVFLIVAYFNCKLAHQILVDNAGKFTNSDQVELSLRQLMQEIRSSLLAFGLRSTDPVFAECFRQYRKPFGNRNDLYLRAP